MTTLAARSIDWKRYKVDDLDRAPLVLMINVISVHVPYTGTGKQSIASVEEIQNEIRLAIMDAARSCRATSAASTESSTRPRGGRPSRSTSRR